MEIARSVCMLISAQFQCRALPCCSPDEPCECRECGCTESASSRPFQAIFMFIAISCAIVSTFALILHKKDPRVIVYDGFTRTHDELVSNFNIPDQDAWAMHFAGKCARAVTDPQLLPMRLLEIDLAYELIIVLPHMWWRNVCGALGHTQGCGSTSGLYWFSKQHVDHPNCTRTVQDATGAPGADFFLSGHPASRWLPVGMALKAHYRSFPPLVESQATRKFFKAERPKVIVVISNVASAFGQYATLTKDEIIHLTRGVRSAAKLHRQEAEIIYIQELATSQPDLELDAPTSVDGVPLLHGTAVYNKLQSEREDEDVAVASSFQEVQLRLMAYSSCFVAPHGGANYATLYFGKPTVLLHPSGEIADVKHGIKFAATLPLLGGSRVIAVSNTTHMLEAISELIETGACDNGVEAD